MAGVHIRTVDDNTDRQREDHLKTQGEGSNYKPRKKGSPSNQLCPHLNLQLLASRTVRKWLYCLSHLI